MEIAFQEFGSRSLANTEHLHHDWDSFHEYPLSPTLLSMSRVWKSIESEAYVIAAKGAPEAISELCRLSTDGINEVKLRAAQMASRRFAYPGASRRASGIRRSCQITSGICLIRSLGSWVWLIPSGRKCLPRSRNAPSLEFESS